MEAKPWYKSRTVWFNVAMFALGIGAELIEALKPLNGDMVLAGSAVGNVVLRTITGLPLKLK